MPSLYDDIFFCSSIKYMYDQNHTTKQQDINVKSAVTFYSTNIDLYCSIVVVYRSILFFGTTIIIQGPYYIEPRIFLDQIKKLLLVSSIFILIVLNDVVIIVPRYIFCTILHLCFPFPPLDSTYNSNMGLDISIEITDNKNMTDDKRNNWIPFVIFVSVVVVGILLCLVIAHLPVSPQ